MICFYLASAAAPWLLPAFWATFSLLPFATPSQSGTAPVLSLPVLGEATWWTFGFSTRLHSCCSGGTCPGPVGGRKTPVPGTGSRGGGPLGAGAHPVDTGGTGTGMGAGVGATSSGWIPLGGGRTPALETTTYCFNPGGLWAKFGGTGKDGPHGEELKGAGLGDENRGDSEWNNFLGWDFPKVRSTRRSCWDGMACLNRWALLPCDKRRPLCNREKELKQYTTKPNMVLNFFGRKTGSEWFEYLLHTRCLVQSLLTFGNLLFMNNTYETSIFRSIIHK